MLSPTSSTRLVRERTSSLKSLDRPVDKALAPGLDGGEFRGIIPFLRVLLPGRITRNQRPSHILDKPTCVHIEANVLASLRDWAILPHPESPSRKLGSVFSHFQMRNSRFHRRLNPSLTEELHCNPQFFTRRISSRNNTNPDNQQCRNPIDWTLGKWENVKKQ